MRHYFFHLLRERERQEERVPHRLSTYLLDSFVMVIGVMAPLTVAPQIYGLLVTKDATGISIVTWTLFALISIPWIVYGSVHKVRPIFWSSALWVAADLSVIALAVYYS